MPLNDQSLLLDQVNTANTLDLTTDDVVFGPVATEQSGRTVTRLQAAPGSGYRGGVTLRYNRLDLGRLFGFFQPKLDVEAGGTPDATWLLAKVEEYYGVSLSPTEVTVLQKSTEEGYFFVVEATDSSYRYSSSAEFQLVFVKIELASLLAAPSDNYVYPTPQETPSAIDALVYSGGWLIPEAALRLGNLLVGQVADDDLMWLTQTLSGDDWCNDPLAVQDFNLADGLVEYNGPVAGWSPVAESAVSILAPPTATRVLAVRISAKCRNLVGCLTFYY